MGRIAGVTAAETRERLLRAAADVFAGQGFDGTRVARIAEAAGVSNGALYAHFASKADLLVDSLRTHGRGLLADLFAAEPDMPITDMLLLIGRRLTRRRDARGYLIVEALVAARRDEDVARPMHDYVGERAEWLAGLMRFLIFPRGLTYFPPSDRSGREIVKLIMTPGEPRERLCAPIYNKLAPDNPLGLLQEALVLAEAAEELEKRVRVEGVKTGKIQALDLPGQIRQALQQGILSSDEADALSRYDAKVMELLNVDDFAPQDIGTH